MLEKITNKFDLNDYTVRQTLQNREKNRNEVTGPEAGGHASEQEGTGEKWVQFPSS